MNWKRIITTWVIVFGVFLLISNFVNKSKNPKELESGDFAVSTTKTLYTIGQEVIIKLKNNTKEAVTLPLSCPKNPFRVLLLAAAEWKLKEAEAKIPCEGSNEITIAPAGKQTITYAFWNHRLFGEPGTYRVEIPLKVQNEEKILTSSEFSIQEPGIFRKTWNTILYRPLLNLLLFLSVTFPVKSLGLGIILLTILVRLVLLVPSQRALKAQKRLQDVQPKLEAIKKKYAGNQERIAKETMALWKQEKVNPFGSCLPLVIQFPVLIALFYVIRNGLNPDNAYLLYDALASVDFSKIDTHFIGLLELTKMNTIVLPLIIGILQYIQMKMAMAKKPAAPSGEKGSEMQMANNMMVYFMPVMIALFTASVPAGVGLYWGISTVFGIGQQLYVNAASKKLQVEVQ